MYDGLASEHIEKVREELDGVVFEIRIQHQIPLEDLGYLLEPVREHDVGALREGVTALKQLNGESWWAIGELLNRAISMMLEYDRANERVRVRLALEREEGKSRRIVGCWVDSISDMERLLAMKRDILERG